MSDALKVRVQLFDDNGNYIGDADVQTSADMVYFSDGETFQQKLEAGKLKGATGATGPQGPAGDKIKVGTTYAQAAERNIFLKIL